MSAHKPIPDAILKDLAQAHVQYGTCLENLNQATALLQTAGTELTQALALVQEQSLRLRSSCPDATGAYDIERGTYETHSPTPTT